MNEKLKKLIECCDLTDVGIENLLRYINYDVKSLIQPQDLNLQWDKCAIIITKATPHKVHKLEIKHD